MHRKSQFLYSLAYLLIVAGFGRMFAWAVRSDALDEFFFRSGIAPLAIAFSHRSGHEDFVIEGKLQFFDESDQKISELPLTADSVRKLPGSMSNKGVLLISSLYAPRFIPSEVSNAIVGLGCPLIPHSKRIHLNLISRKDSHWTFDRDFNCAEP